MSGITVSVVVPYYDAQTQLDLVLDALEHQTLPLHRLEVVVADDGSPSPPYLGERPYRVDLVRQDDRGFRAGAARNLGAAASSGEVLCFLDGDTVPAPGYLAATVQAVLAGERDRLVVGRRRHVDLDGWAPADVRAWLAGEQGHRVPHEHPEPSWLVDAYRRTDNLAAAGDDAYRFVIGAVLTVPRVLFDAVGGFEPAFTRYGGEDWELANRCWLAGADFVHAPGAVAWHHGPDFVGRPEDHLRVKNLEGAAVAPFVTDPAARGRGLVWAQPDVVVRLDDRGWSHAEVLVTVASLLRDTDAGVWLTGPADAALHPLAADPRVHRGRPGPDVLRRCRYQAEVTHPLVLDDTRLRRLCEAAPVYVAPGLTVRRTRDLSRNENSAPRRPGLLARAIGPELDLEREWGRAARLP